MDGIDVKELRAVLGCSTRELAESLDVDQKLVLAWERDELFPTKRHVTAMERLRAGTAEVVRRRRGAPAGLAALADPTVWQLVRKLALHPELRRKVEALADDYDDVDGP